ncbi:hypothetical protein GALMADRAFT_139452 [Galerina marginata CBS 339.88]|uniref:Uncharacterized protein n=1 Tax=Galerina marginata (strain CBS 339.88) TaxID=685588 RepID=A0A067T022_GALM3|nr:hypothetical protein GALMADRAFT_139452 [Galerina marginata CBS 339.88]
MTLVDEKLEEGDEICGAVVSLRSKVDRIQLWTRSKDDVEKLNGIGKRLVKLPDVSEADNIGLEFQFNRDDRPPPKKFLSIQSVPTGHHRFPLFIPTSSNLRRRVGTPVCRDDRCARTGSVCDFRYRHGHWMRGVEGGETGLILDN